VLSWRTRRKRLLSLLSRCLAIHGIIKCIEEQYAYIKHRQYHHKHYDLVTIKSYNTVPAGTDSPPSFGTHRKGRRPHSPPQARSHPSGTSRSVGWVGNLDGDANNQSPPGIGPRWLSPRCPPPGVLLANPVRA
jgi:hypothetical protein